MPPTAEQGLAPATELRQLRTALGLSQTALAAELGVSNVTVNRWEHGAVPVDETALRLARLLAHGTPAPRSTPAPTPSLPPVPPPSAEDVGIRVTPAERCNWAYEETCDGACVRFSARLSRGTSVQGDACLAHLYTLYDHLIWRLRVELARREAAGHRLPGEAPPASGPPPALEGDV